MSHISVASPYHVLGVRPDCPNDDIKRAYRRLAAAHHPDTGGDPQVFREINDAYSLVGTPESRKAFDDRSSRKGVSDLRAAAGAVVDEFIAEALH